MAKLAGRKYKEKTSLKSYKTEIKIHANPGLPYQSVDNPSLKSKLSFQFYHDMIWII